MNRALCLSAALAAMLALSATAARAEPGKDGSGLGGRRVALPGGLEMGGAPLEDLRLRSFGSPAIDDRWWLATPEIAELWIDPRPDTWEIRPLEQRWPDAGRNWLVQE